MTVAAPGNVLLLGEYAVTEPDAPGIALGVLPEVRATCDVNLAPRIVGRMGARKFTWTPAESDSPLLAALVRECGAPPGTIEVDSSAFSGPHGKRGLGSSATVAALVAALLLHHDRPGGGYDEADRRRVFRAALAAHRSAQGGRGSGYDVAASVWGGVVRFTGGKLPVVCRHRSSALPRLYLVAGTRPLATPGAVARYEQWRRREPTLAAAFRRRSRDTVEQFAAATDGADCCAAIRAGGELIRWLGARIGVAVEPPDLRARLDRVRACGWAAKPVGAGGELGVAAAPAGRKPPTASYVMPLALAETGLCWLT